MYNGNSLSYLWLYEPVGMAFENTIVEAINASRHHKFSIDGNLHHRFQTYWKQEIRFLARLVTKYPRSIHLRYREDRRIVIQYIVGPNNSHSLQI